LTETRNSDDIEFGTDRLEEELKKLVKSDLDTFHNSMIQTLDEFRGTENYIDDITIFSCRVDLNQGK